MAYASAFGSGGAGPAVATRCPDFLKDNALRRGHAPLFTHCKEYT
ncbi:hypothetical protein electrica_02904 [Klebsiella electrica]|nr:hypothetical protein electrica_02904 [Klebsiella electrica]BBV76797.1 hypothetical protein STW0522RAO56_28510 [Raoultella planticola]